MKVAHTIAITTTILYGCPGIGVSTETSGSESSWTSNPNTTIDNNIPTENIVTSTSDTGFSESSFSESTTNTGFCGDGIVDEDEYCDNGSENKQYLDASPIDCTIDCKYPFCGDGKHNLSEECDNGDMGKLNGCNNCVQCGNEIVTYPEVCDDGFELKLDSCWGCKPQMFVFLTSKTFQGNFGGLDAADKICQDAIKNSDSNELFIKSLTFKAWLFDDQDSPETRFSETIKNHVHIIREIYIGANDDEIVFYGWEDLINNKLNDSIDRDENGHEILGNKFVWTGKDGQFCTAGGTPWSSNEKLSLGGIGFTQAIDSQWDFYEEKDLNKFSCENEYRFYCFSQ